jgi:hypothetical protein
VYLAYGSNVDPDRLQAYITGSDATSPYGAHVGSADHTPVRMLGTAWVRGHLRFGGTSLRWGGGVALADQRVREPQLFVVRYEVSRRQLVDLVGQENRNTVATIDWDVLDRDGRCRVAEHLYDTLAAPGPDPSEVLLTSGSHGPRRPPAERYLAVLQAGLRAHLGTAAAERYLAAALDVDAKVP